MSTHAANSPSSVFRRIACPGSKNAEKGYQDTGSSASIDGTISHHLLEDGGSMNKPAAHFIGDRVDCWDQSYGDGVVDQDRADRVQIALDYVERRVEQLIRENGITRLDITVNYEVHSNPGYFFNRDDWNGTADILIQWPGGLEMIDYKDGRGYVDEQNNPQTMSYAGGYLRKPRRLKSFEVRTTIVQPKTRNPVRFQSFTGYDLWYALVKINDALKLTDSPTAPRIPGDHCHFCKHKLNCSEYADQFYQGIIRMTQIAGFDGVTALFAKTTAELTEAELSQLLDIEPKIAARFKEVTDEAKKRDEATPGAVPGYGMTPGKGSRMWALTDEEMIAKLKAMKITTDEYFAEKKLKSPAQMEKLQKFKDAPKKMTNLNKLITTVAGTSTFGVKLVQEKTIEEVMDAPEAATMPVSPGVAQGTIPASPALAPGESIFAEQTALPKPPSFR